MATKTPAKLLSFDEIERVPDLEHKDVYVKQWKGTVRVQSLPADQAMEFSDSLTASEESKKNSHIRLIALCCVDENGDRMFTDERVRVLLKKNNAAINMLTKECLTINGLGAGAENKAKNDSSEATPDASPSA